ncbi:MAG: zinc ribbon domain-containing protein [Desulfobacteraceae bacterium]|nr:MAG: zinc ribbon domain-containing protein [Desulfobacteraceae bacterium]
MPIYEYECIKCGHVHEIMQKMSDKPLSKCPQCTGKLQKIISHSAFHLKGSGWYVTDYANKSGGSSEPVKKKNNDSTDTSSKIKENAKATASE